jgi:prepilin-type N-terminal cleavage/methylation domain-containing protein
VTLSHRQTRGFTLVEIMIVTLIVAVAAALVVPMFGDAEVQRLRSAASMLVADMELAQSESIAHPDALRVVVFDTPGTSAHSYRIAPASTPATPITNPIDKQPYRVTFGTGRAATLEGVTIQAYSLGGDTTLGYRSYGQLDQTAAATVTLACDGKQVTISIDPVTGEASVGAIQ